MSRTEGRPATPATPAAGRREAGAGRRRLPLWLRALLALPAGAAAALAFAPFHAIPLLLLAFPALFWLLGRTGTGGRLLIGWAFGFGYFLVGLYWVGQAFLVDADRYAWMLPFAVAGLPAGLALFAAAAAGMAGLGGASPLARLLAFCGAWVLLEWLRGWVLTGFPWNALGDVWTAVPPVAQLAALTGGLGLSALTVYVATVPALFLAGRWRPAAAASGAGLLLLAAAAGGGAWRLAAAAPPEPVAQVRVVQPNIAQSLKWLPEQRLQHVATLLELSVAPAAGMPDVIVWPETAVPFLLEAEVELRRRIGQALPPGALLIAGAPRAVEAPAGPRFRNSLHALDGTGRVLASYDKHHLVPFGEYVPFRPLLQRLGIEKLAAGHGDFGAGPGPALLQLPGLPTVQPLICYEVIFAAQVGAAGRPGWLLNLTNDAWFGLTPGPYQHFEMARLRAIEQGVPLVRAANTGISGVIGPHGEVLRKLGLDRAGAIDAVLPAALPLAPPFARYGELPVLALAGLLLAAGLLLRSADRGGWVRMR